MKEKYYNFALDLETLTLGVLKQLITSMKRELERDKFPDDAKVEYMRIVDGKFQALLTYGNE